MTDTIDPSAPVAPKLPIPKLDFPLVTRREAADLLTQAGYPIVHRTLEQWNLPRFRIGQRVAYRVEDLFAAAQQRIDKSCYAYGDPVPGVRLGPPDAAA